jgi:hypothetical protein
MLIAAVIVATWIAGNMLLLVALSFGTSGMAKLRALNRVGERRSKPRDERKP